MPAKLSVLFKGKTVGLQVFLCRFKPLFSEQLLINQPMLTGDFGCGVAGGACTDPVLFHKDTLHTPLLQKICRENASHAAANNENLCFQILLQLRKDGHIHTLLPD